MILLGTKRRERDPHAPGPIGALVGIVSAREIDCLQKDKPRQDKTRQDTASTLNSQTFSCSSDEACVSVPSLSWHTDDRSLFSTRKRFCVRDSNKQKVRKGACFFPAGRTEQVNIFASISLSSVRSPCQKHAAPRFRSALSPCFSPVCLGRLMQFWN
jgi:hypothetical protein